MIKYLYDYTEEKNIEEVFTLSDEFELKMDKLVAELSKAKDIYVELIKQRDKCKSTVLFDLLNKEISCYVSLINVFNECAVLFSKKLQKSSEDNYAYLQEQLELIHNSIDDPQIASQSIAFVKEHYELFCAFDDLDLLTFELMMTNFSDIVSRNYKDWIKFLKMVGEEVADLAISSTPVLSELKNMYDKVKNIAEMVNEFESNGTDYSEVDKMLFEIESHIAIMSWAIPEFKKSKEILESAENGQVDPS